MYYRKLSGIVRVRKVNGESSLKLNIDDCIIRNLGTKSTSNYYGIVQTDGAVKSVIINMMNSTLLIQVEPVHRS